MAKTYSGIDKADRFFEHYGRKGMKRGMNIYNPNYKPIGEKAQTPKAPGSAMTGDSRYSAPKSAADRQREAMAKAAGAATSSGAQAQEKTRREKLLEAERRRQAKIVSDKYMGKTSEQSAKKAKDDLAKVQAENRKEFINDVRSTLFDGLRKAGYTVNEDIHNENVAVQKEFLDSLRPGERAQVIRAYSQMMAALDPEDDGTVIGTLIQGTDNAPWAELSAMMIESAQATGWDDALKWAQANAKGTKGLKNVMEAEKALNKADELYAKRKSPKVSKEYLEEKEYNSKKNKW